jgi:hypothetical protein
MEDDVVSSIMSAAAADNATRRVNIFKATKYWRRIIVVYWAIILSMVYYIN